MKIRIIAGPGTDKTAWNAAKGFFFMVVLVTLIHPITRGRTSGDTSGARTVLPARILAADMYTLSTEAGGRILTVKAEPGSLVKAGDVLAEIRNPELDNVIERTKARIAILEQRLHAPASTASNGILDEQHRAAVRTYENAQQRGREYSIASQEESYKRAHQKAEKLKALLAQNVVTAQEYEDAQKNRENELHNLMSARDTVKRLEQEADSAESQVRMAKMQKQASAPGADPSLRLDYEEAVAALRNAEERRDSLTLVAPRAGTVLEVSAAAGSTVPSGTPIFKIADLSRLHFDVAVAASIAKTIRRGEKVLARMPSDPPAEIEASVSQVLLAPDREQQSYTVRVTVPNPAPGRMFVGLEGAVVFFH